MSFHSISAYSRSCRAIAVLVMTASLIPAARAAEITSNVGYALEYTDNARLVPDSTQEEWTNVASAGLSLLENSASLSARIRAQAEYRDYKNDIFSDETVLNLNSSILWRISPDRFTWMAEDFLTQSAIQSLEPDTPSNRQQVNVFTTGPDFRLRLSPVHALQLGARYTRNTYETSDLDNTRNSGVASWIFQSSPRTSFSVNYNAQTVDYDDAIRNPNFDRYDTFLQIAHELSRDQLVMNAGTTSLQRNNVPDVDGSSGRFSWMHQVSPVSTFALSISSELSDVGREALIAGEAAALGQQPVPGASITGDVFRAKNASVNFTHHRELGSDVVGLFKSRNEYKFSPSEEERKGGNVEIGYELSGNRAASVFAAYAKTESTVITPATIFTDKNYGLRFTYHFTKNLNLGLVLSRNQRDSANAFEEYTERRAKLTLSYSSSRPFRTE